jgi:hypothetical protein
MTPDDRNLTAYLFERKINDTLKERAKEKQDLSQTRYDVEGETLHSRFWTRSAVGYHIKETIHEFVTPNSPPDALQYEGRLKAMTEIGRKYHDDIQYQDNFVPTMYSHNVLMLQAEHFGRHLTAC